MVVAAAVFAVSVFLVAEARRLGLGMPRVLVGLALFFVLVGAARINDPDPLLGYNPSLAAAFDCLSLVVLALLLANARQLARAAVATLDEARLDAHEYERARREYVQLVRHRLMNPLTAIRGAAHTLETEAGADPRLREELVGRIIEASLELERVTVDPARRRPEEPGLRPVPRV